MNEIEIRRFFDAHCHFREESMLELVLPFTAKYCRYGLAMPNLPAPNTILSAEDVKRYRDEISIVLHNTSERSCFEPIMTIEVRDTTTPQMIAEAVKAGAQAGKIYPQGVTTNSENGLPDFDHPKLQDTFKSMQDVGMLLLLHGELDPPRTLATKREKVFLPILSRLANDFPNLKIVLEHVSSKKGVKLVKALGENVAATITAHHLYLTLNNVIGYGIEPHNGCMPTPKDFDDRDALLEAATSGNPKFFLGSDTAPHPKEKKECAKGACGVFTAPILPEILFEIFEAEQKLDLLQDFSSTFGANFYGLPMWSETIRLHKRDWVIPAQYGNVVPFKAGEKLQWQLA